MPYTRDSVLAELSRHAASLMKCSLSILLEQGLTEEGNTCFWLPSDTEGEKFIIYHEQIDEFGAMFGDRARLSMELYSGAVIDPPENGDRNYTAEGDALIRDIAKRRGHIKTPSKSGLHTKRCWCISRTNKKTAYNDKLKHTHGDSFC